MLFLPKRRGSHQYAQQLPRNVSELLTRSQAFRALLAEAKDTPPSAFHWYPHPTMASLQHLAPILKKNFSRFRRALECGPMLDVGCGDGDLSYFFSSLGLQVTALDNPPTNYNWMAGVRTLQQRLSFPVQIEELDADSQFSPPGKSYGLALLFGTLYHLKNTFYVLETLAKSSRYCVLSTRIASVTPAKTKIEKEPLSYLLDERETNDDSSNYWIFSPAGLLRLVKRSGWRVIGDSLTPSKKRPNPTDRRADSRMFLFLRSARQSSPATLRLAEGWTEVSAQQWAWTLKNFVIEVDSGDPVPPSRFRLDFTIPPAVSACSPVTVRCTVNGKSAGKHTYKGHGDQIFEQLIPSTIANRQAMRFEFSVEHRFRPEAPDTRDLGIIVSFRGKVKGVSEPIGFWLD
jgi:tRNA (mo5U34)-methyltransferase